MVLASPSARASWNKFYTWKSRFDLRLTSRLPLIISLRFPTEHRATPSYFGPRHHHIFSSTHGRHASFTRVSLFVHHCCLVPLLICNFTIQQTYVPIKSTARAGPFELHSPASYVNNSLGTRITCPPSRLYTIMASIEE